jgi:hypothetical protein
MKTYIQFILTVLILSSCGQKQNEKKALLIETKTESHYSTESEYSKEFLKQFQNSALSLKEDTIYYPAEADSAIVLIPKYIPKNQDIKFESKNGQSITIQQINYTDIEFEIEYEDKKFNGKASLYPRFHLGMETVGFSDGEYIITHYYVTETDYSCIDFIVLGNQNIAEEESENVYALVSVSDDTCEDELNEMTNKKLKTVANTK